MNQTERRYADLLEQRRLAGEVLWWRFESVAFRLAEDRCFYHPDFIVMLADRSIEIHEVKGGFIRDDGRDKLKISASLFPIFSFLRCRWKDGKWTITEIGRDNSTRARSSRRKTKQNSVIPPDNLNYMQCAGVKSDRLTEPRESTDKLISIPTSRKARGGVAMLNGKPISVAEAMRLIGK